MALRTKEARQKLTRREQKHLTEQGIHSMVDMRQMAAHMRRLCPSTPSSVCPVCWEVVRKLNL